MRLRASALAFALACGAAPATRAQKPAPAPTVQPAAKPPAAPAPAPAVPAPAALAPAPAAQPPAAEAVAPTPPAIPIEKRLDVALEHYYAKRYALAAAGLYDLFRNLPETELRRDTIEFYLAGSLDRLGFIGAAAEHYIDIVAGRRSPELVARSLAMLDELVRRGVLDERRVVDEVLFGSQFGDLPGDTAEFVEYHLGLGELHRGFTTLGLKRLEDLARGSGFYAYRARYALAVARLAERNDEGAVRLLRPLVDEEATPRVIRNDARAALARQLYEQKKYTEAFELYDKIDSALTAQADVLVEKAWSKVGSRDERRALGMIVGLGAPVYRLTFAPERWLIEAASLDRLCQFRAAHLVVLDFRRRFEDSLARIRAHQPLDEDLVLREAALARTDLVPAGPWRAGLLRESGRIGALTDAKLKTHLSAIYDARRAQAEVAVTRGLQRALDAVAEQLLLVDEQMTILDYEIGVGLFKGITGEERGRAAPENAPIPPGGPRVYYRFDGEYWSDEIQDFEVRAEDRCLR